MPSREVLLTQRVSEVVKRQEEFGPPYLMPADADGFASLRRGQLGPLLVEAWASAGDTGFTEPTRSERVHLLVPLGASRGVVLREDRPLPCEGGRTGVVLSPEHAHEAKHAAGWSDLGVIIPRSLLERHLEVLLDAPLTAPLTFEGLFDLRSEGAASLVNLLDWMAAELELGSRSELRAHAQLLHPMLETFLGLFLRTVPHSYTAALHAPAPLVGPAVLQRAEAYLRAHFSAPLAMADLANEAGTSVRSLQESFRQYRGCTPSQYLRALRLSEVRKRLDLTPEAPVTQVALDCGFAHLGRFAGYYRERFGETPSETRRRALHGAEHGLRGSRRGRPAPALDGHAAPAEPDQ